MSESLFALLVTAALLMLLEDQPWPREFFAGLATLTRIAGVPLIVACILTLARPPPLRGAASTAASALMVAPWLGVVAREAPNDLYCGRGSYVSLNILVSFAANEKVIVLTKNMIYMFREHPDPPDRLFELVCSQRCLPDRNLVPVCRDGSFVPDLFVALYVGCCYAGPGLRCASSSHAAPVAMDRLARLTVTHS